MPSSVNKAPRRFDAVVFEMAVAKKMKDKVKGYAFVIGNKDGIRASCGGGWAQEQGDGDLAMSGKVASCIGSVTKMLSATALLNLLEADPNVRLDDSVFTKLPKKWQQKFKNTYAERITYRQLLQHRSGFRKDGDVANLSAMPPLSDPAPSYRREYSNNNISLLRYLITNLAYPKDGEAIEKKLKGLSFDEYSTKVNEEFCGPFTRYIKKYILEKGLVNIKASCHTSDLMPMVAKHYKDRNAEKGSFIINAFCAPQGTWYTSTEMLVHFARTLLFSNNYLTNTTRNMMFDPQLIDDRLGWSSTKSSTAFEEETGQSEWPYHNGANKNYRAILIQLPYGFVGAALTNSTMYLATENATGKIDTNGYLVNVMMDAFYEATHNMPLTEVARHGIAEKDYQEWFTMITNSGYYPVWVDGYDVAGKTFFNAIFRFNSDYYNIEARHDMTNDGYQQEYDKWVKQKGYRLLQLDNYLDSGKLKLAAIFIKKPGGAIAQPAYHAKTMEQHQVLFDKYTRDGFVPVNVSVVSVGGKLSYAAFYEKRNTGGMVLKSFLTQQEYQNKYDEMKGKKWEQVYINAYHHEGKTRFSAIWYERSGYAAYDATRKSSSQAYQQKWQSNTRKKLLTKCVTGYDEGGKHWFAAHWAR